MNQQDSVRNSKVPETQLFHIPIAIFIAVPFKPYLSKRCTRKVVTEIKNINMF